MTIYQLVFGIDSGQVNCAFHDDATESAGIGPNGEYNCFACGAKAHNEIGFIAKYFSVSLDRATKIKNTLDNVQQFKYIKKEITDEQRAFLNSIGITDNVIKKYFFNSAVGKLVYKHSWNGVPVGYTWFNSPTLSNYNATAKKYKYVGGIIGGIVTPMDTAIYYKTLLITEGEKDMLTAKSMGIPNTICKIGGAKTYLIGGKPLENKNIVLCYDCDEPGREGALADADMLVERFGCNVKVIDLGLNDKEDLNDYFIKYGKTLQDFQELVKNTPNHVVVPKPIQSRVSKFLDSLTDDDLIELEIEIKNRKNKKGER